ncbi:MAG TPA: lytic transglycosylase domain-containing protein [Flavobacterium sp.]
MKRIKHIGLIILVILVSGVLIHAVPEETKKKITQEGTSNYFPTAVDFAGESAPLNISDVRERFERELLVNANLDATTLLIIKRANRAFPVIEPILAKYGVPDDFKYLAVAESGLLNATSSAGAKGFWQFMPETAREHGMEVNDVVDERYHLQKSTEAACRYLLNAKFKFGSWTMAAASYNGGMTGVNKQIEIQKVTNYYDLLLTDETFRYVFRILALKEIMKNPAVYGFNIVPEELYENLPVRKIEVDTTITDLADFAKAQGINYKILKIHNPWLRDKKLLNTTGKKYTIDIPLKGY